ncbi:MAG: hypothetical protein EBX47_06545 [Synechococcaceae bacterium WB8_1B_057]|nr:hypothetical protein [Synechococcaceae bacterium WB6_1A_059]NDG79073.1 hypothetical protein [Synechococcaceae bacterium WB8_1B_057]
MTATTSIEKENLEAHVELCAQRYQSLETRLSAIEASVSSLKNAIQESHLSTVKIVIGTAGTVVASVLGVLIVLLQKMA